MKKEFYFKTLRHFSNFCLKYGYFRKETLENILFIGEKAINGDELCQDVVNKITFLLKDGQDENMDQLIPIGEMLKEFKEGKELKDLVLKYNIFSLERKIEIETLFRNEKYVPTQEFINTLEYLTYVHGLYFLYDENKKLIYIGKSKNLGSRILNSVKERQGFYLKYKLPQTKSDTNILELYYISKFKPKLNSESKEVDDTTFEIDYKFLEESDFILIKEKIEND